jgi:hypothetical protein
MQPPAPTGRLLKIGLCRENPASRRRPPTAVQPHAKWPSKHVMLPIAYLAGFSPCTRQSQPSPTSKFRAGVQRTCRDGAHEKDYWVSRDVESSAEFMGDNPRSPTPTQRGRGGSGAAPSAPRSPSVSFRRQSTSERINDILEVGRRSRCHLVSQLAAAAQTN